jgi:hypothetical protein
MRGGSANPLPYDCRAGIGQVPGARPETVVEPESRIEPE